MGLMNGLDEDAYHATEGGADGHTGHEDAGGYFAPIGNNDEEDAKYGCESEVEDHVPAIGSATGNEMGGINERGEM